MLRVSEKTHARIKNLQNFAFNKGHDMSINDVVAEAINCMPKLFFKKGKK